MSETMSFANQKLRFVDSCIKSPGVLQPDGETRTTRTLKSAKKLLKAGIKSTDEKKADVFIHHLQEIAKK